MGDALAGNIRRGALMHAPFALPGTNKTNSSVANEMELPSIQDFLDELPSIDDFVWAGDSESDDMRSIQDYLEDSAPAADYDEAGWAIADWQSFNWDAAAMLGSRAKEDAVRESHGRTSATAGDRSRPREITPSADEVARALDGIAQRIRSGELLIDQLTGAPPEAAMAAALAALLRTRD